MNYEATDDDDVQPSGNMIPIAIAVLGIVLGTAGLYFGFNANKRLNTMDASMQNSATSTAEIEKAVTFYDARIAELENQIGEQAKIINRLRVYSSQNEQNVKELTGELNKNREQIIKTAKQLNAINARVSQTRAVRRDSTAQPAQTSGSAAEPAAKAETGRTYVITSGDTFGRIAARFGVSVQAIIDANPNADPRRLAIGQKITIPAQ